MLANIPAARAQLIEAIVSAAAKLPGRSKLTAAMREFLRAYFRGLAEEDLRLRAPNDLARAALEHYDLGRLRTRRQSKLTLGKSVTSGSAGGHRATLFVVTDDMPFLVDSLGIVFNQLAIGVHLIIHPVMSVHRDRTGKLKHAKSDPDTARRESWQLIEIDKPANETATRELLSKLATALDDVRAAVNDFSAMRQRAREVAAELARCAAPVPRAEIEEAQALIAWIEERHFVFLGYRQYSLQRGKKSDTLRRISASGLGILRGKRSERRTNSSSTLRGELRRRAREPSLLVLTKANAVATVHRASYLDYIGVKTFDRRGRVTGEHRFLGLWTSTAYFLSPLQIPLLRRKVAEVIKHFGLPSDSHDAKALLNALETYPRDELFQADTSDLIKIVRGIVNLYERHQVRLFIRRDPYERFYSCLVYVPRDRYNTDVRGRIERIMRERFASQHIESQVQLSQSTLARLHMLVRTQPGAIPVRDFASIEAAIADAATTWDDRLRAALLSQPDQAQGPALAQAYAGAFSPAYQDDMDAARGLEDIQDLEKIRAERGALRLNLYAPDRAPATRLHLKIIKAAEPIPISDVLPMLENFGLRVISERPYEVRLPDGAPAWIQDLELDARDAGRVDLTQIEPLFREAFEATWRGANENDGFNRLLLAAQLRAREILIVRAYCRYLLQTGLPFSQSSMERVLASHSSIAKQLVRLFLTQFDLHAASAARERDSARLDASIRRSLDSVTRPDDDRILRSYLHVIRATLRTNYFQTDAAGATKSWLSFKFDPAAIPDLPLPRPKFEIYVYSPRVEGVHLRMGMVARGGLRWSDRREDYRTEVLGLMKAQNVKNTIIVPVGAKGGFFPKKLPIGGTRDETQREGIASYQTFIRGLLDLTDNLQDGKVVPRAGIVRRDGDDPYLVVAADKGTATFSDIANAISIEYGHWLGDAFASGGSAGYDHKGMGITARGAWESVKRHFREIGIDTQSQNFTVAGIGDMAGDVFGNGMLLSTQIRLVAAFNHQHIFLDPNPDTASSFRERQRLFNLPRSTWADYDKKSISKGGGIFERSAKSVSLSAEAQKLLGLSASAVTPTDVLRAILRLPVDLLWNGGIGTYVKATTESHAEVGDRANDAIRANGCELRAKVVGEGGNLGCTQRGRVEYALAGGRINTDFIDNSAGVNTSDVEVNIKILLTQAERSGKLRRVARNKLLKLMTTDVATHVLRNNYLQTQALSTLELRAADRVTEYQSLIRSFERSGDLNRAIEFLPTDDEFRERRKRKLGLSRPELAVVLSYSKIWLYNQLLDSDLPEDPYFASELQRYFPAALRKRFEREIPQHRLRRELVTTATTNSLVNRMGPVFVLRAQEDTGADPAQIARAYTIARECFGMRELWLAIEALDNRIEARTQYAMLYETSRLLRHATYWLLRERRRALEVDVAVRELRDAVHDLTTHLELALQPDDASQLVASVATYTGSDVPAALAEQLARLPWLEPTFDIVTLARTHRLGVRDTAALYFALSQQIGLGWLHERIEHLAVDGPWQAVARTGLRDNARRAHFDIAARVLRETRSGSPAKRIAAWVATHAEDLASWKRTFTDMRSSGGGDFATLSVGVESVRALAQA